MFCAFWSAGIRLKKLRMSLPFVWQQLLLKCFVADWHSQHRKPSIVLWSCT